MTVYTIKSREASHTAMGLAELQRHARAVLKLSPGFVQMSTEDDLVNAFKARGYSVAFSSGRFFREN